MQGKIDHIFFYGTLMRTFPLRVRAGIDDWLEYVGSGDDDRLDGRTLIDWRGDLFLVQTIDLEYDSWSLWKTLLVTNVNIILSVLSMIMM